MPEPLHVLPPSDYRMWVDGSYKDGWIGWGVVILPGWHELSGGQPGKDATEAEFLAAQKAIEWLPAGKSCRLYTDRLDVIVHLKSQQRPQLYAQYVNDADRLHLEAHRLATLGRIRVVKQPR